MNLLKELIDCSKKPGWDRALARAKAKYGSIDVALALQNEERKLRAREIKLDREMEETIKKAQLSIFKKSLGGKA